jgi:hypothetical protein
MKTGGGAGMAEFIDIRMNEREYLIVQVPDTSENELVEAGRVRDVTERAIQSLDQALEGVTAAATRARARIMEMTDPPSEVQLTFQVQLATEAGVVIASTSLGANLTLAFKWTHP